MASKSWGPGNFMDPANLFHGKRLDPQSILYNVFDPARLVLKDPAPKVAGSDNPPAPAPAPPPQASQALVDQAAKNNQAEEAQRRKLYSGWAAANTTILNTASDAAGGGLSQPPNYG